MPSKDNVARMAMEVSGPRSFSRGSSITVIQRIALILVFIFILLPEYR